MPDRSRSQLVRHATRNGGLAFSLVAVLTVALAGRASAGSCESGEARALYETAGEIVIAQVLPTREIEPDALVSIRGSGFDRLSRFEELTLEFVSLGSGSAPEQVHVALPFTVLDDGEIVTNAPFEILPGKGAVRLVSRDCTYIFRSLGGSYSTGYSVPPLVLGSLEGLSFGAPFPSHESHPDAASVLYLDFNGHHDPAFDARLEDANGQPVLLNLVAEPYPAGLADIHDIWRRVAEDFAPFDVNVTTDPLVYFSYLADPSFQGAFERVVIGGDQYDAGFEYRGGEVGGVADLGSHTSVVPVLYGGPRTTKETARSASHEAGHQFSFYLFSRTERISDFISHRGAGRPGTAALMGTYYEERRDLWAEGPGLDGYSHDEVGILAAVLRHRQDVHPSGPSSGARLETVDSGTLSAAGVIETVEDRDAFAFYAEPGTFTVQVNTINESPDDHAANLDADMELWRQGGTQPLVETGVRLDDDPLSAEIEYTVATGQEGVYYVVAKSRGEYGDVGQYEVFATGRNVRRIDSITGLPQVPIPTPTPVTLSPIFPKSTGLVSIFPKSTGLVFTPSATFGAVNLGVSAQGSDDSDTSEPEAPAPSSGTSIELQLY